MEHYIPKGTPHSKIKFLQYSAEKTINEKIEEEHAYMAYHLSQKDLEEMASQIIQKK